jgi:hypothetical protein
MDGGIRTNFNKIIMPYSTCCGAHTNYPEIDICPECLDHCDWEEEDEEDILEDLKNENDLDDSLIKNQDND